MAGRERNERSSTKQKTAEKPSDQQAANDADDQSSDSTCSPNERRERHYDKQADDELHQGNEAHGIPPNRVTLKEFRTKPMPVKLL